VRVTFTRTFAPLRIAALLTALLLTGAAASRPLRIGMPLQPNTLYPLVSSQYQENYIEEAIFDGLVVVDDRGNLQPDLAQVVPTKANGGISADGKTITYHLRHGVKWHDGVAFTARDVAFTFATLRDPKVPFVLSSWYKIVDRLDTPDPYTVVLHLHQPSADATGEFFVDGEFGMIVPEHILRGNTDPYARAFGSAPIGTGPYRVEHWQRGAELDLRANPDYFRGAPHIDRIQIEFVQDQNTLAVQKHTGELDFVNNLPLTQITTFTNSPAMTVRVVPAYILDYLVANLHAPPFDDVRVRRAFALAIDRDALVRTSYHGAADAAQTFVPPWSRFYAPLAGTSGRPDLRAAGALLDAAGWHLGSDGLRHRGGSTLAFALTTMAAQTALLNAAVELQADWHALGANVDLRPLQSTVLFSPDGVLAKGQFTLAFIFYGELPWPDISDNVSSASVPPRGSNYSRFADPVVDRALRESRETDDVAARRRIVAVMSERLHDAAPLIPVVWERFLYAWNGDLLNVRPETVNSDFWNVAAWAWR
jgi:peptide/nickel transport system substrate-binding protein